VQAVNDLPKFIFPRCGKGQVRVVIPTHCHDAASRKMNIDIDLLPRCGK
jgi:hypothetical protein